MATNDTLKQESIKQLGSTKYQQAADAVNKLREYGWLFDGSLRGASLKGANLYEVYFYNADFAEADFTEACLQGSDWLEANTEHTIFKDAELLYARMDNIYASGAVFDKANIAKAFLTGDLHSASFRESNLQGTIIAGNWQRTSLERANLRDATLISLDLRGVNLTEAVLQNASLENVVFDEQTILPDGTHWSSATDMSRFTTRSA